MKPTKFSQKATWACSVAATVALAALVAVLVALVGIEDTALNATEKNEEVQDADKTPSTDEREMEVVSVGLDMITQSPIILLREPNGGRTLPIWVGVLEAQSIMRELQGIEMPRPMTHDLMVTLLRETGAEVVKVKVDDLRDGTYFGKLILRVGDSDEERTIDSRPSDALALAIRTGASIHVAEHVLEQSPDILFVPLEEGDQIVSALEITVVGPRPEHRRQFQLPDDPGALVVEVSGEAERRGLQRGDLITHVDDQEVDSPATFFEAIQQAAPDSLIEIRYLRGETEHELELPKTPTPREEAEVV